MPASLHIGEAARLLGITPKTIRHYHKIGLLAEPKRTESGYRCYGAEELLLRQTAAFELPQAKARKELLAELMGHVMSERLSPAQQRFAALLAEYAGSPVLNEESQS